MFSNKNETNTVHCVIRVNHAQKTQLYNFKSSKLFEKY